MLAVNKPLGILKNFYWESEFSALLRLNKHQQKPHRNTEWKGIKGLRDPTIGIWTLWPAVQRFRALPRVIHSVKERSSTRAFCVWLSVPSGNSCFRSLEIHSNNLWSWTPHDKVTTRSGQQETQTNHVVPYPVIKFHADVYVLYNLFKFLNYIELVNLNVPGGKLYFLSDFVNSQTHQHIPVRVHVCTVPCCLNLPVLREREKKN